MIYSTECNIHLLVERFFFFFHYFFFCFRFAFISFRFVVVVFYLSISLSLALHFPSVQLISVGARNGYRDHTVIVPSEIFKITLDRKFVDAKTKSYYRNRTTLVRHSYMPASNTYNRFTIICVMCMTTYVCVCACVFLIRTFYFFIFFYFN